MSMHDPSATPDFAGEPRDVTLRLSPLQQDLLQWLRAHTPSLTDPYIAAANLLQGPDFPGRLNLVCFCMRDLFNILPAARRVTEGRDAAADAAETTAQGTGTQNSLIGAKRKAKLLLRALPQAALTEIELEAWVADAHRLQKWFADHHHFSHEPREQPSEAELRQNIDRFERLLLKATHTFFGLLARAEEIVSAVSAGSRTPTATEVGDLSEVLQWSPEFEWPLFRRLDANWLRPLREQGFFTAAPDAGAWPASQYLVRVAGSEPEEVADILRGIEPQNTSVLRDVLDAASKMPPSIAGILTPMVSKAISLGELSLVFPQATDFCVHLANGGETEAAMNLAEVLFVPQFDEDREYASIGPREHYWYVEGLKKIVPLLAGAAPGRFLKDLCEWMTVSITAKEYYGEQSPSDGSDHWRPAIEEHTQNRTYDFVGDLVGLVRQGFEQAIDRGRIELGEALRILAGREYSVFKRLRVHLINRFAERDPELARATMMDPEMFKDSQMWLWHEYAMLMRRRFRMLLPEQQATWLGRIETGPVEQEFWWNTRAAGREATEEDRRTWLQSWQAVRLHWIAEHLSGERRTFYEKMSADWEDPDEYDFHFYSLPAEHGWQSPISAEELTGLNLANALDKISAWQPSKRQTNLIGEGTEGLATAFGQYVRGNAEKLSGQAELLERQEPKRIYIYVRTFIEQMAEAVKAGRKIDLAAVLRLCKWVVEQPISGYGAYFPIDDVLWKLVDSDWQWARYAICRVIQAVCDPTPDGIPPYPLAGKREAIGALLKPLAEEPAKSHLPEEAAGANLRVYDPLTAAINTPRGIAVEAILAYARWIANHIATEAEGRQIVVGGFDAMPEVRERLEWQIAPENASFEAFAVVGAHFGLLHWIDESWVKANAERIFDLTVIEREPTNAYGWAAWNSFLDWRQACPSHYQILRPQYVYAVKHLAEAVLPPNSGRTPIHRLGTHLVVLYGRRDLKTRTLDDEKLLFDFLRAADSGVRSQTIAFVGSALAQSKAVPEAVVDRFQKLWDWYWPEFGEKDVVARPASGSFGSWFRCEQFPITWRLERLEAVVTLPKIPDLAEQVVERLAISAEADAEHIGAATRILDRMIRADKEGWRAYAWREPAGKILGLAMRGDDTARDVALCLIDHLGRRGHEEFRNLLRHGGADSDTI
jgi:hypothetical protein